MFESDKCILSKSDMFIGKKKYLCDGLFKTNIITIIIIIRLLLIIICLSLVMCSITNHYQKIDKYKRKYRGNISVGKFSRDFTDGNIPSVYTEGITVEKKIKTKQKTNDDVSFLPTELPTKIFPSIILLVNPSVNSLVNCEHCSLCQLQRESPTEISVGIFQRAPELFTFQLHC
jgi:hypothetical protein